MKKPSSPEKTAFSLLFGVYKPVEVFLLQHSNSFLVWGK